MRLKDESGSSSPRVIAPTTNFLDVYHTCRSPNHSSSNPECIPSCEPHKTSPAEGFKIQGRFGVAKVHNVLSFAGFLV